ncbi:MAG: hypothetical protein AAGF98_17255 [Cyanobacteria bacterium P01_H01_bin.153]
MSQPLLPIGMAAACSLNSQSPEIQATDSPAGQEQTYPEVSLRRASLADESVTSGQQAIALN